MLPLLHAAHKRERVELCYYKSTGACRLPHQGRSRRKCCLHCMLHSKENESWVFTNLQEHVGESRDAPDGNAASTARCTVKGTRAGFLPIYGSVSACPGTLQTALLLPLHSKGNESWVFTNLLERVGESRDTQDGSAASTARCTVRE